MDGPGTSNLDDLQKQPLVDIYHDPATGQLLSKFNPIPPSKGSAWDKKWRKLNNEWLGDLAKAGIACFSEISDSLPMWVHYTNQRRGYCLEFSTAVAPFADAEKVSYVEKLEPFDPYSGRHPEAPNAKPLLTKLNGWSYEHEWRIIEESGGDQTIDYPVTSLTAIYFGDLISRRNQRRIQDTAALAGLHPNFYSMKTDGLTFVPTPLNLETSTT